MRKVLLDTCGFLWWLADDPKLGQQSRAIISNPMNLVFVSAAVPWEIGIKKQLGKLVAPDNIESIIEDSGFKKLAITCFHAEQSSTLPLHHRDTFDRVMIAQSQAEGLEVITDDRHFEQYGIRVIDAHT
jgi:PIN domain nuclease of toxin-antitoxin system